MAPRDASEAEIETSWTIVCMIVAAGIVCAFQIGKAPAALPELRADLGMGLVAAGWVISMFNLLGVGLGMVAGSIADRLGHRRFVLIGLSVLAAASLAGAASPSGWALLATRFLEGLGFIITVVAGPGLIVRVSRLADVRLSLGLWSTYMPAGTAFMMVISPLILAPLGWRGLWLINGIAVALFTVALWRTTRGVRAHAPATGSRDLGRDVVETLTAAGPLVLALAFASYTLQYLAVLGFLPTILIEQEGVHPALATTLTAIAIASNVIGNLAGGALLHRGVPRWSLVAIASLVMGLCAIGIYQAGLPLALRYGLCVAFSMIGGVLPAATLGGAPVHAPRPNLVATTNGLIMQGSNLGQVIGPPAVAALAAAQGGWSWSPAVISTSAAVGIGLAFVLRALERGRIDR